jgi:hypothetical protein
LRPAYLIIQNCPNSSISQGCIVSHPQDDALFIPEEQAIGAGDEIDGSFTVLPDVFVAVSQLLQIELILVKDPTDNLGTPGLISLLLTRVKLVLQIGEFSLCHLQF